MRVSSNSRFTEAEGKIFGEELRRLRKEAGMSTKQFGEYIGISQTYLSNLENSNRKPSPQLAQRIAEAFDLTVDDMLVPLKEKVAEERRKYGKELSLRRNAKGLSSSVVAGALGIPLAVYKEYELGECSITEREKTLLDNLFGDKPQEAVETEVECETATTTSDVPLEICDIILGHIKDLQIDTDEQKKVWRYFSTAKLEAEERRLFG
jgi:transcriptional regulator with XRE-family HTH domain